MKAYVYFEIPQEYHRYFPRDRGGGDESNPHCTVLYVGDIEEDNLEILKDVLEDVVENFEPITCSFGELKSFPVGDYGVPWYVEITAPPELEQLHRLIWDHLKEEGVPVEHSHPEYKPHATLKYLPENDKYDGEVPAGSFTIKDILLDVQ